MSNDILQHISLDSLDNDFIKSIVKDIDCGKYLSGEDIDNYKALNELKRRFNYLSYKYEECIMFHEDNTPMGGVALVHLPKDSNGHIYEVICLYLIGKTHIDYIEIFYKGNFTPFVLYQTNELKMINESHMSLRSYMTTSLKDAGCLAPADKDKTVITIPITEYNRLIDIKRWAAHSKELLVDNSNFIEEDRKRLNYGLVNKYIVFVCENMDQWDKTSTIIEGDRVTMSKEDYERFLVIH